MPRTLPSSKIVLDRLYRFLKIQEVNPRTGTITTPACIYDKSIHARLKVVSSLGSQTEKNGYNNSVNENTAPATKKLEAVHSRPVPTIDGFLGGGLSCQFFSGGECTVIISGSLFLDDTSSGPFQGSTRGSQFAGGSAHDQQRTETP